MKLYIDIETEGLTEAELTPIMPEFEAAANIKDPEKIANAIKEKKADWLDKTALKAVYGKIVAVTVADDDEEPKVFTGDEKKLVNASVEAIKNAILKNSSVYAWNGFGFDYQFICQRAALYGIMAFGDLMRPRYGKFYWHENLIDPKLVWSNYSLDHTGTSLKTVAYALGLGLKDGNGKDFAGLLKTNPDEAIAYAKKDIELLRGIVLRMGI